ncbi:SDR family NAD(P)-dependent oxidoreductase [Legionella longbeachae]|uniref:Putative oxidoreductases, short-chain dehydrogenase/reductase family n=1 Tax=Legionella longbeachae serogroup 1 (strain NSW150) TaxID=661367 RepID=D3HJ38_LEGLN|nr:SDR family NAD(P)-dependent oxidoreductase [Legionella longbeachae]VEE02925.1 oxidoreductases, short-chain dehydrogenase/reductase family [Legionella oakridgensis]HBD7398872.1 SDR family oxidoreductase [Legionella pneumophila]ARB90836.1 SDR family NAD(P)-dependent oxidoreductase [Legionella longbeachae]ARM32738.1 SDR family oxidoreductase [Legionella longbeachae]EEZ94475.1 short chain dehydrogenase/reductase family oxidoreductase [Legionella longbeachae D-4968]
MKVAVITGAASGIGLALTQIHLQRENFVVMVDKDSVKLKNEATRLSALFPEKILEVSCDITHPNEVAQLAQHVQSKLGRIDWIYNNAGIIGQLAPIWDLCPEQIQKVMDVNLHGMIYIIQAFAPFLFEQVFHSHIINIASLYALCTGSQTTTYSMSKHAVLALSESLYFDLKRMEKPVNISVVFPSFTDTALLSHDEHTPSQFKGILKSLLSHSRPAIDIADHIVQEVEQKKFYIFPDKEVKGYCEERTKAMILQDPPYVTNIEKLMGALMKRQSQA